MTATGSKTTSMPTWCALNSGPFQVLIHLHAASDSLFHLCLSQDPLFLGKDTLVAFSPSDRTRPAPPFFKKTPFANAPSASEDGPFAGNTPPSRRTP